jgi:hypothetical protein
LPLTRQPAWGGFPLQERDRRWQAVRDNAAKADLDCLFVPLGNRFDARYLTLMMPAVVVLPTDGRPPLVVNDRGRGNDWVAQARAAGRAWAKPSIEALLDAGMDRARIGVVGLRGGRVSNFRAPDGVLIHGAYAEVTRALPEATFVDATNVVGFARYVKSDWEVERLREAAAIAEAGIDEMGVVARPGVEAATLYGRVTARMMSLGGEHYPQGWALTLTDAGEDEPTRYTQPPVSRVLQPGTLIENEVTGVWGGYQSQEDQPILLAAAPSELARLVDLHRDLYDAALEYMKPGADFAEVSDFIAGFGKRAGIKAALTMASRGMGDDGPLVNARTLGSAADLRIEQNTVWVFKPTVTSDDGRWSFEWGGTVVVTSSGARKLFERPHQLVSIEA